jgi:hypothetical protein
MDFGLPVQLLLGALEGGCEIPTVDWSASGHLDEHLQGRFLGFMQAGSGLVFSSPLFKFTLQSLDRGSVCFARLICSSPTA